MTITGDDASSCESTTVSSSSQNSSTLNTCKREGCESIVDSGSTYCSEDCAIKDTDSTFDKLTKLAAERNSSEYVVRERKDKIRNKVLDSLKSLFTNLLSCDHSKQYVLLHKSDGPMILASQLEDALFTHFGSTSKDYNSFIRRIKFNLNDAANEPFRERFFGGELTPDQLASMSHQELANELLKPQLKKVQQDIRERSLHDTILVSEYPAGPLLKKTHKGPVVMSPKRSSTEQRKESISQEQEMKNVQKFAKVPLFIDTKSNNNNIQTPLLKRKAGSEEYEDMFHNTAEQMSSPLSSSPNAEVLRRRISPVFSEVERPPTEVWSGRISLDLDGQDKFPVDGCKAWQIGDRPTLDSETWEQILNCPRLTIIGIISPEPVEDYLIQQRVSTSKDLVLLDVAPDDITKSHTSNLESIHSFLLERQRYGVIRKSSSPNVKDMYVIPIRKGSIPPLFLSSLASGGSRRKSKLDSSHLTTERLSKPWSKDGFIAVMVVLKTNLATTPQQNSELTSKESAQETTQEPRAHPESGQSLLETLASSIQPQLINHQQPYPPGALFPMYPSMYPNNLPAQPLYQIAQTAPPPPQNPHMAGLPQAGFNQHPGIVPMTFLNQQSHYMQGRKF